MKLITVAMIGAGPFSRDRHLQALARIEGVSLVGLCDLDEACLRETGDLFHITPQDCFTDYRKMLETKRPDAVYAIMAPHRISEVALEILDRGHPLFIEKPPGLSTAQTESMAQMASRKKLVTAVGFQRRYHPLVRTCWEVVTAEKPLHRLRVSYHKWMPPDLRISPYYEGAIDILRCDAVHAVDAARFYAGLSDVKEVQSVVRKVRAPFDNCFQALVLFENGVVAGIDADWASGRRFFKFEFHTPAACAYVNIDGRGTVWKNNQEKPVFDNTCIGLVDSDDILDHGGFLQENQAFIKAVRTGCPPHNRLEDAVKSMQLIDIIYANASLAKGAIVPEF